MDAIQVCMHYLHMSRKSEDQKNVESNEELRNIVSVNNYVDAIVTHYGCSVYKFPFPFLSSLPQKVCLNL